jgi:hypothetical protein
MVLTKTTKRILANNLARKKEKNSGDKRSKSLKSICFNEAVRKSLCKNCVESGDKEQHC